MVFFYSKLYHYQVMLSVKTLVFCLSFVLLTFFFVPPAHAQDRNTSYVPGQLIIKYKDGQSHDDLIKAVEKRRKEFHDGLLAAVKLFAADLKLKLDGKETPELKFYRLAEADLEAGVSYKKELFEEDSSLENFYQIKLNSTSDVEKAVRIFRSLPEVEFVEPNFLTFNAGI